MYQVSLALFRNIAAAISQNIFSSRHSIYFERKNINSESALYNQLLKLIEECGVSFSAGTFKKGLKFAQCQTINFVQGSGEAQTV